MDRLKVLFVCAMLAFCGLAAEARAAVLIIDGGGQLTGARGVDVSGTLYDVDFLEGSCLTLFDGCDNAAEDFIFSGGTLIITAAKALMDQVFVDGPSGLFDSDPTLTQGCDHPTYCLVLIPYIFDVSQVDGLIVGFAENHAVVGFPDSAAGGPVFTHNDTTWIPQATYARFTPAAEVVAALAVAEPSSFLLFGAGVIGLAFARRRRSGKAA